MFHSPANPAVYRLSMVVADPTGLIGIPDGRDLSILRVLSWLHQRAGSLGPYSSAETPAASGIGEDSGWGSGHPSAFRVRTCE